MRKRSLKGRRIAILAADGFDFRGRRFAPRSASAPWRWSPLPFFDKMMLRQRAVIEPVMDRLKNIIGLTAVTAGPRHGTRRGGPCELLAFIRGEQSPSG